MSPVFDEIDVKDMTYLRRDQTLKDDVCLLPGCFRADEAQSLGHPVYVGVDREGG